MSGRRPAGLAAAVVAMAGLGLAIAATGGGAAVARTTVPAAPSDAGTVERHLAMMGTSLAVMVEADRRATALAASERAVAALEATEARLSTWRDDSELARLNRAPAGRPVAVTPELAADLAAARRCWRETGGAFDPTVGALAAAWGIRAGGRTPSAAELRAARAATGMAAVALGGDGVVIATVTRGLPGLVFDEGGFGKGAGLDRALAALAAPGVARAWLDLGGQVAVAEFAGAPAGQDGTRRPTRWRLAVADPADRGRPAVALAIDGGSAATSGTSERGRHLLDPRRGRPAADFGSLTVWAPSAVEADCLSTGLYAMGADRALAWAAARPGVEALVLARRGGRLAARATGGLAGRLAPLAPDVEIEIVAEGGAGGVP